MTKRLLLAACALAALAAPPSAPARAADAPLSTQIVDAMNKLFGAHPGFRANHAKGVVATGRFTASPEAAALSKAQIFDGTVIPVTVRFSDATGVPNLPDGVADANPHGLSIKFHQANGKDVDWVINSLKLFPVATGEEFRDLLQAVIASPPGAPQPTPLETFINAHPAVPQAFASIATPDSFADEQYNGVNAFVFIDKDGHRQAVRTIAAPEHLVHLDPAEAAKQPPDFLIDELPLRLAKGPVIFRLQAQLAAPEDSTKDPTKPWPADRKIVDLGVLTIDKPVDDSLAAQKKLLFLPTNLTDGIALSDDPMPLVRSAAYLVSFGRRVRSP